MNPIRLELTPEQLAALGGHTPGPRKALSPLPPEGPTDPEMDKQLIQAGLLDPNQQVKEPFGDFLSALGKTEVMVDLSWAEAGEISSFSLYAHIMGDDSAAWVPTWAGEAESGRLLLQSPFTRQDLEAELAPVLQEGEASTPALEIGLTPPQAVVLSVLMDKQSPFNAAEESGGHVSTPQAWDAASVLGSLQGTQGPDELPRYFSVPLLAVIPALDWNLESVQHVLNSLVRLGLCTQSKQDEYSLAEPMRKMLEGFVVPGKIFWLTIRRSSGESDELPETEAEHIGFSLRGTNLVFSWLNGNFRLKTVSKADVVEMIAHEIFAAQPILPPAQHPATPAVQYAAAPVMKKKVPKRLIAGLVGVLLLACVLMVVGAVLLLV